MTLDGQIVVGAPRRPPRASMPAARCARPAEARTGRARARPRPRTGPRRRRRRSPSGPSRTPRAGRRLRVADRHASSRCASSSSPIRYERPPPMTSTASPGRTSPASQAAVASTLPGASTRIAGVRAATAAARPAAEADRRVGVAAGPDVGDRHGVGRRERRGERRRATPPSGGRSGARTPPRRGGPARAGGRRPASRGSPSGGGRSRRRPRRPGLALPLEPPPHAPEPVQARGDRPGIDAKGGAAPATPRALAALWRPAVGSRTVPGRRAGRPAISRVVVSGSVAVIRPRSATAGPLALPKRTAIPRAIRRSAAAPRPPAPSRRSARASRRDARRARRPRVAHVGDQHGAGVAPSSGAPASRIHASNAASRPPGPRTRRGGPTPRTSARSTAGR